MIDAVFISDLHLNQNEPEIFERFKTFILWAAQHTRSVYILGDFFHAWAGDDCLDEAAIAVADELAYLATQGVVVYFMKGNRDFLVGQAFAARAGMKCLVEPHVLSLGDERVVLVHGDRYCTQDKAHQGFRRLTRNRVFEYLFLQLPKSWRQGLVAGVRGYSQAQKKPLSTLGVVPKSLVRHLKTLDVMKVIHGHTHQPGLTLHEASGVSYEQYVLSDWDDKPHILCYDKSKGLYYLHINE